MTSTTTRPHLKRRFPHEKLRQYRDWLHELRRKKRPQPALPPTRGLITLPPSLPRTALPIAIVTPQPLSVARTSTAVSASEEELRARVIAGYAAQKELRDRLRVPLRVHISTTVAATTIAAPSAMVTAAAAAAAVVAAGAQSAPGISRRKPTTLAPPPPRLSGVRTAAGGEANDDVRSSIIVVAAAFFLQLPRL